MTPNEFRAWLRENDYTERELAHELGVHWTTPYKWLTGEMRLTPLNERALSVLTQDKRARDRRLALRMTTDDLRAWMEEHEYNVIDLGYAFDMPERAVLKLLDVPDGEPLPRLMVLGLRGLARERKVARPKGMTGDEFKRWLSTHRRSQKDVADAFGVSLAAVSRWCAAEEPSHRDVSPMTRLALKTLERKR